MFKFTHIYTKWILLGLIIIAGVTRFIGINTIPLDISEQLLWFFGSKTSIIDAIEMMFLCKPTTLLLGITTWLTNSNNEQIEFISRLFSFLSGIVTVPLIFILARKFYSELEGLLAAGIITFSWLCIGASQTLSEHSIFLSLEIFYFISLITYFDRISEEYVASNLEVFLFIISGILLGLSSIWGILIVIVTFFYSFFFVKKISTFIKIVTKFICIIFPLAILIWGMLKYSNIFEFRSVTFNILPYLKSINYIISNNYLLSIILISPLFYLVAVYFKRLMNPDDFGEDARTKFNNSTLVLTIWLIGSIGGFICSTLLLNIKYEYTDLIFLLPPAIILISRSIILFSNKLRNQIIFGGTYTIIVIIACLLNINYYNNRPFNNPDYNSASRYIMRYINKHSNNNYGIVFTGMNSKFIKNEAHSFYLKKYHIDTPIFNFNGKSKNITPTIDSAKKQNLNYLWYISDDSITDEGLIKTLKSNAKLADGFRYRGITLYLIEVEQDVKNDQTL